MNSLFFSIWARNLYKMIRFVRMLCQPRHDREDWMIVINRFWSVFAHVKRFVCAANDDIIIRWMCAKCFLSNATHFVYIIFTIRFFPAQTHSKLQTFALISIPICLLLFIFFRGCFLFFAPPLFHSRASADIHSMPKMAILHRKSFYFGNHWIETPHTKRSLNKM